MFKIPYLFHVKCEYAVTVINPRQRKRAGAEPSDVTQKQFWSTGSGCSAACLGKKYSHTNYHLCSMSIPLLILHISQMR